MKNVLVIVAASLFLFGCAKENASVFPKDVEYSKISFNIVLDSLSEVKSSLSTDENYIGKMAVWAYNEESGLLESARIFSSSTISKNEVVMSVRKIQSCSFFFLANCDAVEAPRDLSNAKDYIYFLDGLSQLKRAFPMSACLEHVNVSDDRKLDVSLERLVARYNFRIDCSKLKGKLSLTSAKIMQSAMDFTPFKPSKSSLVAGGDYASDTELTDVLSGKPAYFYIPENCRGDLSKGNTNPWAKIPSDPKEAGHSTYLEVHVKYESPTLVSEDLTYRMFLGKDNLENYDICRNGIYTVTLVLSDLGITQGILNSSWKVDPGDYQLVGELKLGKKIAHCAACYQAPFIRRSDGSTVVEVTDTVPVLRSSQKLSYSLAYNVADYMQAGVNVSDVAGKIIVKPGVGKSPEGYFDFGIYSYDVLLSDSMKVCCGIMDLNVKFDHPSGEVKIWSTNGNPAGAKLKIVMDYEVCSSAWGGTGMSDMHTYYDKIAGSKVYTVIPADTPVSLDNGQLCSAIRNASDGIVPNPNGLSRYMPYSIKLDFQVSTISPESCVGRTLVRFNSGIFNQPSVGFVHNEIYIGQWYLEYAGTGQVNYYRKSLGNTETAQVSVSESCNGIVFNSAPNAYSSAVFEI